MNCSFDINDNTNNNQYDRLNWDSTQTDAFLNTLNQKSHLFQELTDIDEIDVNNAIDNVSELIYNVSFQYFGRIVPFRKTAKERKALWFNDSCNRANADFLSCKREYQSSPNVLNKSRFLDSRFFFAKVKREAKRKVYYKERSTLSKLSKTSPRTFWKYLNKFKRISKNTQHVVMQDFVNNVNNNTTTDDAGSVNGDSNDGLVGDLNTE